MNITKSPSFFLRERTKVFGIFSVSQLELICPHLQGRYCDGVRNAGKNQAQILYKGV